MCLPAAQAITQHSDGLGAALGKTPQLKSGMKSVLLQLLLLLLLLLVWHLQAGRQAVRPEVVCV